MHTYAYVCVCDLDASKVKLTKSTLPLSALVSIYIPICKYACMYIDIHIYQLSSQAE